MREIKFRAWDNDRKEMFRVGNLFIDMHGELYLDTLEYNPRQDRFDIMQFTGFKDKHGNEIYEGDVVGGNLFDDRIPTRGAVCYDAEHACYASKNCAGLTPLSHVDQIKILGNVYQNPELLEALEKT